MKVSSILQSCILLLPCFSCNNTTTTNSEQIQTGTIFLQDFYNSLEGLSTEELSDRIDEEVQYLDSTYYIEYASPINNYSVKVVLRNLEPVSNLFYEGSATMFFTDSCSTRSLVHPTFVLNDSIAINLRTKTVNILNYDIDTTEYYLPYQLGQFSDVPFAFFDVDFDGELELLLRHPFIGQRGRSVYSPFRESLTDLISFEKDYIYSPIDSLMTNSGDYAYYPILDDMTELYKPNTEVIIWMSAGWSGSEKLYFKVTNQNIRLSKIETFDKQWEQLVTRVTYTDTDTITETF